MIIAVVGNRQGWTYEQVKKKLLELGVYKSDVIVSGGAEGVDTFAQMYAKENGNELITLYPDPSKPSPERYFDRNKEIILRSDMVIAFDKGDKHSGTLNSINYAKGSRKPMFIVHSDGSYETIEPEKEKRFTISILSEKNVRERDILDVLRTELTDCHISVEEAQ